MGFSRTPHVFGLGFGAVRGRQTGPMIPRAWAGSQLREAIQLVLVGPYRPCRAFLRAAIPTGHGPTRGGSTPGSCRSATPSRLARSPSHHSPDAQRVADGHGPRPSAGLSSAARPEQPGQHRPGEAGAARFGGMNPSWFSRSATAARGSPSATQRLDPPQQRRQVGQLVVPADRPADPRSRVSIPPAHRNFHGLDPVRVAARPWRSPGSIRHRITRLPVGRRGRRGRPHRRAGRRPGRGSPLAPRPSGQPVASSRNQSYSASAWCTSASACSQRRSSSRATRRFSGSQA